MNQFVLSNRELHCIYTALCNAGSQRQQPGQRSKAAEEYYALARKIKEIKRKLHPEDEKSAKIDPNSSLRSEIRTLQDKVVELELALAEAALASVSVFTVFPQKIREAVILSLKQTMEA